MGDGPDPIITTTMAGHVAASESVSTLTPTMIVEQCVVVKDGLEEIDVPDEGTEVRLSSAQESALLRKLDWRLLPVVSFLYLICFLDRVNIGNARIVKHANASSSPAFGDMESDLGMTWNGAYNWALSIFFVGYILFEVPSNLMLKRATPRVWIMRIMVSWGICAAATAFVRDFAGLMATRFFLGVAEAGFFPGIIFYLSFWYRKREYTLRTSVFFSASTIAGAFSGLFGYFLSQVQMGLLSGWRAVIFWEGVPAIVFGVLALWMLPNFPQDARFLTPLERRAVVDRLKLDGIDPRDHSFSWSDFVKTIGSVRLWLYMLVYLGILIPTYGFSFFLPTIIKLMGFSSLNAQLLSAPPYIFGCIFIVLMCMNSDRTGDRSIHLIVAATLGVAAFFALAFLRGAETVWWQYFFTGVAVLGVQGCIPLLLSWMSNNNQVSQTSAATATAMTIAFGNLGGVIGPQIYRPEWAYNQFQNGHIIMACAMIFTIMTTLTLRTVLIADAKRAGGAIQL